MEVVEGTKAERKGGHIARRRDDGRLVLRESAQVPPEDSHSFGDYRHWRYFNTNNLWVESARAPRVARAPGRRARAAADRQPKTVDPRDSDTPAGDPARERDGRGDRGASREPRVLCVPRTRFAPVKTTDDLLVVRSDVYTLTDDWQLEPVPSAPARRRSSSSTRATTSCSTSSRRASPTARRRCARPSGSWSRATSPSGRGVSAVGRARPETRRPGHVLAPSRATSRRAPAASCATRSPRARRR